MVRFPTEMVPTIQAFAGLFSPSVFQHAQVLLMGTILAPGQRMVTSALRVLGLDQESSFQNYHRVLNRAKWSGLAAAGILLRLLVRAFAPLGPLIVGIDEARERRRGKRITAKGTYYDPVRSSKNIIVKSTGLRWISMMLLAPIPWPGLPLVSVPVIARAFRLSARDASDVIPLWSRPAHSVSETRPA